MDKKRSKTASNTRIRLPVCVILASASPRRQEMLQQLGIPFQTCVSSIRELREIGGNAERIAMDLAKRKALACRTRNTLVIGMDTVVVVGRTKLGKPENPSDAKRMLNSLSNRMHRVITGVSLVYGNRIVTDFETTKVYFRRLFPEEIEWYISTGEARDKAGAYGVQGLARLFVTKVDGCYYNVVGFPIACFQRSLRKLGFTIYDLMKKGRRMKDDG